MTTRQLILDIAIAEIGDQGKGSPQVEAYWRSALPPEWSDAQVHQYADTREWCGGFALWCLHRAGLALDVHWRDGHGFVDTLPHTCDPQPGDIVVFPALWHHAIVEEYDGRWLTTIDGNQPGVKRRSRDNPKCTCYSIEPWLQEAPTVPGVPPRMPTIRFGATGAAVRVLQTRLRLTADGAFGPRTEYAVRTFQGANGLRVDGVVGAKTWKALGFS